jgi:hypothetical protein
LREAWTTENQLMQLQPTPFHRLRATLRAAAALANPQRASRAARAADHPSPASALLD